MQKDDTIFTVRGRLRLLVALNEKTGREAWFACDRGFLSNDTGAVISDMEMIQVLIEEDVNIPQAFSTPDPREDSIINARVEVLVCPSG